MNELIKDVRPSLLVPVFELTHSFDGTVRECLVRVDFLLRAVPKCGQLLLATDRTGEVPKVTFKDGGALGAFFNRHLRNVNGLRQNVSIVVKLFDARDVERVPETLVLDDADE